MPKERFYIPQPLHTKTEIILEKNEHHHLANVMRGKKGDLVEVINGLGSLAQAQILDVKKKESTLCITEISLTAPPQKKLTLYQAIPRLNRLDTIIEKCTELGVTEIYLWPAQLSERKELNDKQLERLKLISIAAMKQCGRLYLPKIFFIKEIVSVSAKLFYGDMNPSAPLLKDMNIGDSLAFATGPEGGLTPQEIAYFQSIGAKGVSLHQNVLRTDTASIVAIAFLSR